jgi:hypothetical protein
MIQKLPAPIVALAAACLGLILCTPFYIYWPKPFEPGIPPPTLQQITADSKLQLQAQPERSADDDRDSSSALVELAAVREHDAARARNLIMALIQRTETARKDEPPSLEVKQEDGSAKIALAIGHGDVSIRFDATIEEVDRPQTNRLVTITIASEQPGKLPSEDDTTTEFTTTPLKAESTRIFSRTGTQVLFARLELPEGSVYNLTKQAGPIDVMIGRREVITLTVSDQTYIEKFLKRIDQAEQPVSAAADSKPASTHSAATDSKTVTPPDEPFRRRRRRYMKTEGLVAPPQMPSFGPSFVGICGAPTRDGTPCQHRVSGGGRCFQHQRP